MFLNSSRVFAAAVLPAAACAALFGCQQNEEGVLSSDVQAANDTGGATLDGGQDVTGGDDGQVSRPNNKLTRMAYVAGRGVSTPWFVPIGGAGPSKAIQLAPRRGAGYGLGEGNASYPNITPDGKTVVVAFYPMNTPSTSYGSSVPVLFALRLDGTSKDKPVRLATAKQLHALKRVYTADTMAYVDGGALYTARLDGSDAKAPVLVAQAGAGQEISAPRWLVGGKRLSYATRSKAGGSSSTAFVAAADGSQVGKPVKLMTAAGAAEYVVAELPDGRLIVRGPDNRLYSVAVNGASSNVVLTPKSFLASTLGVSADGARLVVELRTTWQKERRIVSVATDGSQADKPVDLTPQPMQKLSARMSRDRTGVAWTAVDASGQYAAWRCGLGANDVAIQASAPSSTRLYITAYDHGADIMLGSRDDGAVLRFRAGATPPKPPQVLDKISDVVNHSIPWPVLSADGKLAIYDANTKVGWQAWTVSVDGGTPVEVDTPWYRDLVTPWGILHHEYVHEEAAFVTDLAGHHQQLSPWNDQPLKHERLVQGGKRLIFASTAPTPGWYSVDTAGTGKPTASMVMPAPFAVDGKGKVTGAVKSGWDTPPVVVHGHLVRRGDGHLEAFAVDGSNASKPVVLGKTTKGPWCADLQSGRVAFASAFAPGNTALKIVSARVDGSDGASPVPVMTLTMPNPANVLTQLLMLGDSGRVLAAVHKDYATELYAAAIDGSQAKAPLLLATGLAGWMLQVLPTPSGSHVLTVHSIEATAVAHPDLLMATATGTAPVAPDKAAHMLAPKGFLLWGGVPATEYISGVVTSADGLHVVLTGAKGLHSVRLDGADSNSPTLLGNASNALGAAGVRSEQHGDNLLLTADNAVQVSTIGVAGSQRTLTQPGEQGIVSGLWIDGGQRVVFLRGSSPSWAPPGELLVVDSAANKAKGTPLVGPKFGVSKLLGEVPGGKHVIVESIDGMDHSLYLVPLDGSSKDGKPVAVTPVDDTSERLIGFVPAIP